jgi:regulator of protease activity HflC (stomatin/prohibitin superfamily)
MTVDAVVYFRVIDPAAAVVRVEKYLKATSLISQTTLRSVLGKAELDELLSQRDKIMGLGGLELASSVGQMPHQRLGADRVGQMLGLAQCEQHYLVFG